MILRISFCLLLVSSTLGQVKPGEDDDINALIEQVFGKDLSRTTGETTQPPTDKPSSGDGPNTSSNTFKPSRETSTCTCVPYYLCNSNGTINTDGSGLLDIRIRECGQTLDVCCEDPLEPETAQKPTRHERKGCGQRHPEGIGLRITGDVNNEAQFGEFPWMVAVMKAAVIDDTGERLNIYQCGGALIHEKVVLTAAHCVAGKTAEDMHIRAGEWDTQSTSEAFPHQNRKVAQVIVHPRFQSNNLNNDFALLVLEEPVTLGENIDIVCLPPEGRRTLNHECYASGWGKNEFGQQGAYQVILKKIDLPMVPRDQCIDLLRKTRLGPLFRLHESFVCAGGIVGKDTCKGDGGSPLVCPVEGKPGTYEAVGLVAWGIGCGNETPGVYASVAFARRWVDEQMDRLQLTPEY